MSEFPPSPVPPAVPNEVASATKCAFILLVDDEAVVRESLSIWLRSDGHRVVAVGSVAAAQLELERARFDVLLADMILGDGDGTDLLQAASRRWPEMPIVAMSGFGTIESAVHAIKAGAFEYLTKPLRIEQVRQAVRRAIQQKRLLQANRSLRRVLDAPYNLDAIVGRTHRMQRVLDLIEAVADSKATVLIHGETGTGKSLVARAIHQASHRRSRPFVEVSCGAIPETLLESELFGHTRGAFTGALAEKDGKFKAADGGTIFLDEVSAASAGLQVKLLRVLQDRQFEALGSNRTETVDVRVVLATNVDLEREVAAGRFRQDLFYRINVVNIALPPLRDRLTDIPLLAEHFLHKYSHQSSRSVSGFTEMALQAMQRFEWPGNVRELENCVERAVVLTRGALIDKDDLPPQVIRASESSHAMFSAESARPTTLKEALAEPERRIIQTALEANGWNRQKTADVLDVNRTTLYKKMKRYGLLTPQNLMPDA